MLLKQNRLRHKKDFEKLFEKGKKFGSKEVVLAVLNNEDRNTESKLGVIISKKQEKSAVKRNRARRQARAILREMIPSIPKGKDIAVVIKASFLKLDSENQRLAIQKIFQKAGIL